MPRRVGKPELLPLQCVFSGSEHPISNQNSSANINHGRLRGPSPSAPPPMVANTQASALLPAGTSNSVAGPSVIIISVQADALMAPTENIAADANDGSDLGGTPDGIPQDCMEDDVMKDDIDGDILGHQWQWQL